MDTSVEVVNLTGQVLRLVDENGGEVRTYPRAPEPPPRVEYGRWEEFPGLPVPARAYPAAPKLSWVPEPRPGIVYVVPPAVGVHLAGRADCFVPGRILRDEMGVMIGNLDLCRVHPRVG
jgi:hypothetical protein